MLPTIRATVRREPATAPALQARLSPRLRQRREPFGAVVYVPERDHFFALDHAYGAVLAGLDHRLRAVRPDDRARVVALARMGICETEPPTARRAFYGRSQLGDLPAEPVCTAPLVVNCFTTAHCPLRCTYCHADDLMVGYRDDEDDRGLREVMRVGAATPAMVGVVTGGEPLWRPERAERLIAALAADKAVVLDTSGVGDLPRLLPLLRRHGVHVRVSLDSADAGVNDALRPASRRYLPPGASSTVYARDAIRRLVRAGVPRSVQTVVTARNGDLPALLRLRDLLGELGVTTWALHVVVPVGKAAAPHRTRLLAAADTLDTLAELVRRTAADAVDLDIRVTGTHRAPHSVLLVSAKGELAVEDAAGGGKTVLPLPRIGARRRVVRHFRERVDPVGHASRYLNGTLDVYPAGLGED